MLRRETVVFFFGTAILITYSYRYSQYTQKVSSLLLSKQQAFPLRNLIFFIHSLKNKGVSTIMQFRFSRTFKILAPMLSLITSVNAQLVMPSTATLKAYPIGTLEAITKRLIVCDDLIHRNWGYPDGVSALLCDDAMTACVRLGIYHFAAEATKKGDLP